MNTNTLDQWLTYIRSIHDLEMELGLERIKTVASRLKLLNPNAKVITVGGTNGKGSSVAGLEAIYLAQGYKVGAYTSPHLLKFNERIRLQGKEVADERLCQAFEVIEEVRGDISLTFFEFVTLAALEIFSTERLDVYLLEVGLGGRLDAVNIIDADLAMITSISYDHEEHLGFTREAIAKEKAGIFRFNKPAVYGDFSPPKSLLEIASALNVFLFKQGKDFSFEPQGDLWQWRSAHTHYENLPTPTLSMQNMANVLMAIELMQPYLPVKREAIDAGLTHVKLPGRMQVIEGDTIKIFDVSHNPASAEWLTDKLKAMKCHGKTRAVFSMLTDKDIATTIRTMKETIDEWHIAELNVERGASISHLLKHFENENIDAKCYPSIKEAYRNAIDASQSQDRVVVFGSFHTVSFCCEEEKV